MIENVKERNSPWEGADLTFWRQQHYSLAHGKIRPKIRFPVLEGDKLMKEVLNGGYNVHPVPPPNSDIKERIRKRYERERIKIEKLLTLGYTTSGDP